VKKAEEMERKLGRLSQVLRETVKGKETKSQPGRKKESRGNEKKAIRRLSQSEERNSER
jgi:hypothetical protein